MQFRQLIIILIFLIPCFAQAQEKDIAGLWKGTLFNDTTQKYYKYEIGISKEKGKYSGFSHTWFTIGDTQYFGVKKLAIKIAQDGKIIVEDNGLIAHNYPVAPNKGVKQLNVLTLDASDSIMKLTGPFSTNRTKDYHSLTGSIQLQRKNDFWQSSLVPHLQELSRDEELSFVKQEKQELAKADKQEQELQLAARLQAVQIEKDQVEKEKQLLAETRRIATEKETQEKTIAKQTLAQKDKEQKQLTSQQAAQKEEEKKQAAEKDKTEKLLARQERDKKIEVEKEAARQALIKERQDRLLAKQSAAEEKAEQKTSTVKPGNPVEAFKVNIAPAAEVATRKTVVQQTVTFSSDSLELSLYDNGEIDGDTVSVLMNGQLILAKQGLGIKAIKHTIRIPQNIDTIEMIMYAETLGSIPPNTGLLVIKDGKDLYEIRFSGDLQKNAAIIFNRKKE